MFVQSSSEVAAYIRLLGNQICSDSLHQKHLQTFTTLKNAHKTFLHSHLYDAVSMVSDRSLSLLKVKAKVRTECRRRLIYRSSPVYFVLKSVFLSCLPPSVRSSGDASCHSLLLSHERAPSITSLRAFDWPRALPGRRAGCLIITLFDCWSRDVID